MRREISDDMVKKFVINKVKALEDSARAFRLRLKKTYHNKKLPIKSDEESSLVDKVIEISNLELLKGIVKVLAFSRDSIEIQRPVN